jgi:hypothetical protein
MEACKMNKIDPESLTTGAIIGKAILYNVKYYKSRKLFLQDRGKHLAGIKYFDHRYGFLIKNAKRFRKPLPIPGKLRFFNVEFGQNTLD